MGETSGGRGGSIDTERLVSDIRRARALLPAEHRNLLTQIGTQETAVEDWPSGVQDLYLTVRESPPSVATLQHAAAVWLDRRRTVAFNAPLLHRATAGLDEPSRRRVVADVAWHEYGHALSLTRSTRHQRSEGPRLLELLPAGLRESIDYPGSYRRMQVFDEIVATIYPVMIARACVRKEGYGAPRFLHPEVFDAFKEVIPWPPSH